MKFIFQGLFQLLKKPWCRGYRKMGKPKAFSSHLLKYLLCSVLLPYSSVSMKQESGFMFPKYSGNIQGSISIMYDKNWWNIRFIIFERTCLVQYYHLNSYVTNRILLYSLKEVIYLNSSDLSFALHNHIMQLWYHPVKLRLKISFAGIPILVQEIANEPSLKKLFILNVFLYHLFY